MCNPNTSMVLSTYKKLNYLRGVLNKKKQMNNFVIFSDSVFRFSIEDLKSYFQASFRIDIIF